MINPIKIKNHLVLSGLLILLVSSAVTAGAAGFTWPWQVYDPWPHSSDLPVTPLDHPDLEERATIIGNDNNSGFHFAVFGDQRILADGEWQEMITHINRINRAGPPLSFLLDTGDIIWSGRYGDQYAKLKEILAPVRELPYLVCLGNHEVCNNREELARHHSAAFLSYLDPSITPERFYYQKQIGRIRFIFLDTNDLVYGDDGSLKESTSPVPGSRAEVQMAWLTARLAEQGGEEHFESLATVVVMHHPFIQTAKKHRSSAKSLWKYRYAGRTLPDILLDGGVDLILTGHTHTYERYLLERHDKRQMHIVNLSGRPRRGWLRLGEKTRKAHDISGDEMEWLTRKGWSDLTGWQITQVEVMAENESDQFGLFSVDQQGVFTLKLFFLDGEAEAGIRQTEPVVLRRTDHNNE